jgi:hypothetical protein
MPDDFTCQVESAATQWVKWYNFSVSGVMKIYCMFVMFLLSMSTPGQTEKLGGNRTRNLWFASPTLCRDRKNTLILKELD